MTYLPQTAYPQQVQYVISSVADLDQLALDGVITKTVVFGPIYKYVFPITGTFGVTDMVDLGNNYIEFVVAANQQVSLIGLSPISGFRSDLTGAVLRITPSAGVTSPTTYSRLHFQGLTIMNVNSAGRAFTTSDASVNVIQRVTFVGCTFRQGPANQVSIGTVYGGGVHFLGCDFSRDLAAGTLDCFIETGNQFNTWGTVSFDGCSFMGKRSASDTVIDVTYLVARMAAGGSPVNNLVFQGCYISNVNALCGSTVGTFKEPKFFGCSIGKVNYLHAVSVANEASVEMWSTDVAQLVSGAYSGVRPWSWYAQRIWEHAGQRWLDSLTYGSNQVVTRTPGATENDWYLGSDVATTVYLNPAAPSTISGIGGSARLLTRHLINISANNVTFLHDNALSLGANRILCSTGANIVLAPNGLARATYDHATLRWHLSV